MGPSHPHWHYPAWPSWIFALRRLNHRALSVICPPCHRQFLKIDSVDFHGTAPITLFNNAELAIKRDCCGVIRAHARFDPRSTLFTPSGNGRRQQLCAQTMAAKGRQESPAQASDVGNGWRPPGQDIGPTDHGRTVQSHQLNPALRDVAGDKVFNLRPPRRLQQPQVFSLARHRVKAGMAGMAGMAACGVALRNWQDGDG